MVSSLQTTLPRNSGPFSKLFFENSIRFSQSVRLINGFFDSSTRIISFFTKKRLTDYRLGGSLFWPQNGLKASESCSLVNQGCSRTILFKLNPRGPANEERSRTSFGGKSAILLCRFMAVFTDWKFNSRKNFCP